MAELINYLRVEREITKSNMTYRLPFGLPLEDEKDMKGLDSFVRTFLPGWSWICATVENPSVIEDEPNVMFPLE